LRPGSPNLFELDAPSASGTHALGLPQVSPADVKLEPPANDASAVAPLPPLAASEPPPSQHAQESAAIDAEFAALANTSELERPLAVARSLAPKTTEPAHFDTRVHTHVAAEASFDVTLKLPKVQDTLEARRGRLAVRYKAACAAYKVLAGLEISSHARKELIELFAAYEASLKAALPPAAAGEVRDSDQLHNSLPAPGFEEHERALTKVEDRLLAADDTISEEEFRANVSLEKQPAKILLRYARLLAARRFNVGFRRDRFEYLAFELLTNEGPDKRLSLLPRDQAGPVLHHLLAGLAQVAAPEERGPAVEHLREALDRLAQIDTSKDFFDSEFFLDLHGYKISMRDQVTCPEFLYLSAALHVELHNRLIAWSRASGPALAALRSQLQGQQRSAEDVFTNFRRPRSSQPSAAASSPRPAPAKEALPQPVPPRRKKRKPPPPTSDKPNTMIWVKLAVLALVIVISGASTLYTSGMIQVGTRPTLLSSAQLQTLSPLLLRATVSEPHHRLDGLVSRPAWKALEKRERRALAADLATKLKQMNIPNAQIMGYKSPLIQIEYSTVVYVDES
jgi:hypothetical protein